MNQVAREMLAEVIGRFGPEVAEDARRCEAILRDLCGEQRREIAVLVAAIRERVTIDLREANTLIPRDLVIERCVQRLRDNAGLSSHLARWSVETWALALGVIKPADVTHLFQCPLCGTSAGSKTPIAGKLIKCPKCQARIRVSVDGRDFVAETKTTRDHLSATVTNETESRVDHPAADPFAPAHDESHEKLRNALRRIMADGVITQYEKEGVQELRESLGIPAETARQVFQEVKAEQLARSRAVRPALVPPPVKPPPAKPQSMPPIATPMPVVKPPPPPRATSAPVTRCTTPTPPIASVYPQGQVRAAPVKPYSPASGAVRGPAIGLLVAGIIGGCSCLLNAFAAFASSSEKGHDTEPVFTAVLLLAMLAFLPLNGFVCYASLQMLKLEAFRQAITASVLVMIPCSGCCLLGVPIGIWSLIVLMRPDVKASFHG